MANGMARIFLRKSVGQIQSEHEHGELKRSLGALNLVLLGIGCIIGTGIFVLTGRAAAEFAGPGIMISFVITGILCALVAICYSELAARVLGVHLLDALSKKDPPEWGRDFAAAHIACCCHVPKPPKPNAGGRLNDG